ncbi:MAG TPA: penicillin-insensitive murein endopeptidase [Polyangiaceae bacterium]|nr:penicillin-insensitive murein endopeptidase [Polyangiaceae bacterium]
MVRSVVLLAVTALFGLGLTLPAAALDPNGELPARFREGRLAKQSLSVGYPNEGRQVRAKRLGNTRELHVRGSSRSRAYGHPALVLMLVRSAADVAKAVPGSVLFVGDLSAEDGGPLSGHRSHQSGRDADVGFYLTDLHGKRVVSHEYVAFDGDGRSKDGSGYLFDDERNWALVESWAKDRRAGLSHIFVSDPLRARLLDFARRNPKHARHLEDAIRLLKQPEHGEPHDDHFHVRITCPKEQLEICRNESKIADARIVSERPPAP